MKLALAHPADSSHPRARVERARQHQRRPWGATQEDLRVQLQRAGETVRCDSPELCVNLRASFGSVPVDIKYIFPKDGKLEMVILTFRPADYRKLRAVFVERYGEPMSAREEACGGGCGSPPMRLSSGRVSGS